MMSDEKFGAWVRGYRAVKTSMRDNPRETIEVGIFIMLCIIALGLFTGFGSGLASHLFGSKEPSSTVTYGSLTMSGSPGSVQIEGNNNVVSPVAKPELKYHLQNSWDYNNLHYYTFAVNVYVPPTHSGNFSLEFAPGISCTDQGGSYSGLAEGPEFGTTVMTVYHHLMQCTSVSPINDNGRLIIYKGEIPATSSIPSL